MYIIKDDKKHIEKVSAWVTDSKECAIWWGNNLKKRICVDAEENVKPFLPRVNIFKVFRSDYVSKLTKRVNC